MVGRGGLGRAGPQSIRGEPGETCGLAGERPSLVFPRVQWEVTDGSHHEGPDHTELPFL